MLQSRMLSSIGLNNSSSSGNGGHIAEEIEIEGCVAGECGKL